MHPGSVLSRAGLPVDRMGRDPPPPARFSVAVAAGTPLVLLGGQGWGPWLLPSLVPPERLCLPDSSHPHPQIPGSRWWAEGTDRNPGETPGQPSSLVLWVAPSWGTFRHPQLRPQNRNRGGSVPCKEKAFRDFSSCADIPEPHSTSLPPPEPQHAWPFCPALLLGLSVQLWARPPWT